MQHSHLQCNQCSTVIFPDVWSVVLVWLMVLSAVSNCVYLTVYLTAGPLRSSLLSVLSIREDTEITRNVFTDS